MTYEQAISIHQFISKNIILNNSDKLEQRYGSIETAQQKLLEVEYFLNYGTILPI